MWYWVMAQEATAVMNLKPSASDSKKDREALEFIEKMTTYTAQVQEMVLREILSRNANTEYLRRHGLAGRTDPRSFKTMLPVVTYEELLPEIRRIANGDRSPILSAHPISEFLTRYKLYIYSTSTHSSQFTCWRL